MCQKIQQRSWFIAAFGMHAWIYLCKIYSCIRQPIYITRSVFLVPPAARLGSVSALDRSSPEKIISTAWISRGWGGGAVGHGRGLLWGGWMRFSSNLDGILELSTESISLSMDWTLPFSMDSAMCWRPWKKIHSIITTRWAPFERDSRNYAIIQAICFARNGLRLGPWGLIR